MAVVWVVWVAWVVCTKPHLSCQQTLPRLWGRVCFFPRVNCTPLIYVWPDHLFCFWLDTGRLWYIKLKVVFLIIRKINLHLVAFWIKRFILKVKPTNWSWWIQHITHRKQDFSSAGRWFWSFWSILCSAVSWWFWSGIPYNVTPLT